MGEAAFSAPIALRALLIAYKNLKKTALSEIRRDNLMKCGVPQVYIHILRETTGKYNSLD